jgi:hypothetical protein
LGSWEERKICLRELEAGVCGRVREFLGRAGFGGIGVGEVELEGDAYKVYKKNKWNVMYELSGSIKFTDGEKNGEIVIVEFSSIGDRDY